MPAPEIIHHLVQQFKDNRDAYRSGHYNEAQLRQEFLNPFFETLGWDVANSKGYSINYREVVHEDSIHIKGSPHAKAPDYAFRLGGVRKFFVEAKKPAEDIQFDRELAYQLKVYAWNVGLPLSILTDFEEFAVYDCRNKPNPTDSPAAARILYVRYDEYIEKWDEIASVFSPLAIQKGAFDRFAIETKSRKGTTKVDDAFLADIEKWRTLLARNIALRNQHIVNERQLNYAVQMTIDRIIFLRISEDRGIEPENQLLEFSKQRGIYPQLVALYQRADIKYNSGLFHFKQEKGGSEHIDKLTPTLEIDDKVLKEIIKDLYYPCPYIFKEIPVEILGQVYEQFLGKVIRLTPGRQAKIEEKPEVRKAGGVYYTPSYIVDYIVANTVGKLVEGKSPEQVNQLKILDPACGSGSFLLGAFQYLLDWHESWYLNNNPAKWAKGKQPALLPAADGSWKLTTAEKKRILVNNIYGVDIDAQAVEVTKLSLLLKVLEEESGQLSLGLERVLPDLSDNIKCGNSLIGWDYFEGQLIPDEKEIERVNPFDWQRNFPQVFAKGGFDAVIGNPPYGATLDSGSKKYLSKKFSNVADFETSQFFIAQSQNLTNKGYVGYIVPNTIVLNLNAKNFRRFVLENFDLPMFANLSNIDVFQGATVRTIIMILSMKLNISTIDIWKSTELNKISNISNIEKTQLLSDDSAWVSLISNNQINITNKISGQSVPLGTILNVSQGLIPYDKYRGHSEHTIKNRIWNSNFKKDESYKKELRGGDVTRYKVTWNGKQWISYGPWLAAPRKPEFFNQPRLLFREITDPKTGLLHVAFTSEEFYNNPGIINAINKQIKYSLFYILGICASRLLSFFHFNNSPKANKGIFPKILVKDVRSLPIKAIDFTNPKEVEQHDRMVSLVERMIELHKREPFTPQEADHLQRQIIATDAAIDKLVYELYGLTEEEISIVEGNNP